MQFITEKNTPTALNTAPSLQ